jgi:dCTP diphosphatase
MDQSASIGRTSVNDLKDAISTFIEARDWEQFHSPKKPRDGSQRRGGRDSRALPVAHRRADPKPTPEKLAAIREEIGDVMIYLTELADKLGIDPVEAAMAKVKINGQKYPAELVKGKAAKYTEYK